MAQTWRPRRGPGGSPPRPLDQARLEERAIAYVGRYATTRARLSDYLKRKLAERGWDGASPPDIAALVDRMAALGYVDDRAFAGNKAAALGRRGYGGRRVAAELRAAGVAEEDAAPARAATAEGAWDAALAHARRRRIGPYAATAPDRDARRKALAAMLRAGHDMDVARRLLDMTEDELEEDHFPLP